MFWNFFADAASAYAARMQSAEATSVGGGAHCMYTSYCGVEHTCSHRRQFVALEQQVVEAESARLAEEEEVDHGVEE